MRDLESSRNCKAVAKRSRERTGERGHLMLFVWERKGHWRKLTARRRQKYARLDANLV